MGYLPFVKLSVRLASRLKAVALLAILLLAPLFLFFPPDGMERAQWAQFAGRFHFLVIHFPIALILLVPVLELAGRRRSSPGPDFHLDLILALATYSAIVSSLLGWCLARSGGSSGPLLTQHMWGGFSLAAVCWLCWVLRGSSRDLFYASALLLAAALVSWTGYRGGQLSQGENHLTEYMPAAVRLIPGMSNYRLADASLARRGPPTFYSRQIQPIFDEHCTVCHGESKQKGKLRLDSYELLMRGGKHGPVIAPGNPGKSELFRRITLPSSDDDFMPAQGKPPLPANEIKLIQIWIAGGASSTQPMENGKELASAASSAPAAEVTFQKIDMALVARDRAPLASAVAQLQQQFPGAVEYESRGSADLTVDLSGAGAKFGDQDMSAFKAVAGRIVEADFSNTAITDRSAGAIAAMTHLRVLRLNRTRVTDATILALASLQQLESLSVFGTAISPAALPPMSRMPRLAHVYAGETKVSENTSIPQDLKNKVSF